MGPTGYTAAGKRCGPIHDGAYCLKEEPEAGEQHRRNLEEERYEENRDQDNDTREREKSHVTTEYPGNRPRGAQRRNSGVRVQYRVGYRRQYPAGEIKCEITSRAELVLDRSPEQPQGPHIDDQVQPTAMQKHIADEGQINRAAAVEAVAARASALEDAQPEALATTDENHRFGNRHLRRRGPDRRRILFSASGGTLFKYAVIARIS